MDHAHTKVGSMVRGSGGGAAATVSVTGAEGEAVAHGGGTGPGHISVTPTEKLYTPADPGGGHALSSPVFSSRDTQAGGESASQ